MDNPPGYEYDSILDPYHALKEEVGVAGGGEEEHDYDEPYFEPASEVEDLMHQLSRLNIHSIQDDALK